SVGDDLVQPAPGNLARRSRRFHSASREAIGQTSVVADQLSRKRAGVSAIPVENAAPDRRSFSRHLSYPGHSLRKHHPPDPYSVVLAMGGHRSGAATEGVWLRFERDCHRRHHLANRHRQEERHYAYRLRPSRRARTSPPAGGGDLSSLHQTLPADSHDDDGGDAWGRAAHARHWNGLRDTRAARLRHRRGLALSQFLTLYTTPVDHIGRPRTPAARHRSHYRLFPLHFARSCRFRARSAVFAPTGPCSDLLAGFVRRSRASVAE